MWMTTKAVAEYLGYRGTSGVRNLKLKGQLRPVGRRGSSDMYLKADVDAMVAGRSVVLERKTDERQTEQEQTRKGESKEPSSSKPSTEA